MKSARLSFCLWFCTVCVFAQSTNIQAPKKRVFQPWYDTCYHPQDLEPTPKVIDVMLVYGCGANWTMIADAKKSEKVPDDDRQDFYHEHQFYLEAAKDGLEDVFDQFLARMNGWPFPCAENRPDSFYFAVRLKGNFYKEKGYPKGYRNKEHVSPARVFRYQQIVRMLKVPDSARW